LAVREPMPSDEPVMKMRAMTVGAMATLTPDHARN